MSTPFKSKVNQWSKYIQFFLFPGICIVCKQLSQRHIDLCSSCEAALPKIARPCQHCGLALPPGEYSDDICGGCLIQAPLFKYAIATFEYCSPVNSLISDFKYHAKLHTGRVLARQMLTSIERFYQDKTLPDMLIPVPLHRNRIRFRGYNQAQELARFLGKKLHIKVNSSLCSRHLNTEPQSALSASQRMANLQDAFSLVASETVSNRTIAIVDDVITTMSTANALSRLLLQHGAKEVHVWSIARTSK